MGKYLTIAEIAELAGIPNSTCRRYLASFESFFLVRGGNRVKKYEESAVKVLKRVKHLYEEGQDTNEIHDILRNEFPLVIDDDHEQGEAAKQPPGLATVEDIAGIRAALQEQKEFNKVLLEKLEKQQEYINSRLDQHDKLLMESLKESMEARKQIAATKNEKKSFWQRIFKRN